MSGEVVGRAVSGASEPPLRALPPDVVELLVELDAPPRLGAHLRAVHDVAAQLLDALPELAVDREAVLFGAATHDIGKVEHPGELSGPGSAHEPAGTGCWSAGVSPRSGPGSPGPTPTGTATA